MKLQNAAFSAGPEATLTFGVPRPMNPPLFGGTGRSPRKEARNSYWEA